MNDGYTTGQVALGAVMCIVIAVALVLGTAIVFGWPLAFIWAVNRITPPFLHIQPGIGAYVAVWIVVVIVRLSTAPIKLPVTK